MRALVLAISLLGCSGGGSSDPEPSDVDAAFTTDTDASVEIDAVLPLCTRAAYDRCDENADCDSNNCHLFMQDGFQVCTQACDAANPCPQIDGQDAICNNKGICKPPGERACSAP